MIVNTDIIIKPNNHSINHYLSLGYDAKCRKELLINIEHLTPSSNIRVDCKCDKCFGIKNIKYQDYMKCISRNNFYVCEKCKFEKTKISNKQKYGDENYWNIEKKNDTMLKLYNCKIPLHNIDIKNKKEMTCIKRYGFKNASENTEVKNKIKKSNIEIFKDISKKNDIINKRKTTCLKKYNFDSFSKSGEYKIKNENTCLKRYGYVHNGSVPLFILKRRKTRLKNTDKIERTEFYFYKKEVMYYTRKVIKELYNNWNGYDYYDGEYIKENIHFKYNNGSYPSIDHKISTYYGFKNKIHPKYISNINNLCITKKSINSKKRDKIIENGLLTKLKLTMICDMLKNKRED